MASTDEFFARRQSRAAKSPKIIMFAGLWRKCTCARGVIPAGRRHEPGRGRARGGPRALARRLRRPLVQDEPIEPELADRVGELGDEQNSAFAAAFAHAATPSWAECGPPVSVKKK